MTFRSRFILIGLLGVAAALRLVEAYRRPLQVDEAMTLNVATVPWPSALEFLRSDVHPPLLFYALHWVEAAQVPDIAVRMAIAFIGIASVALLYYLVRLWADVTAAAIAAVCAALMPSLLFYDSWIRMYAPFEFLALGSFILLSLAVQCSVPSEARTVAWWQRIALWAGWAICTALMWYTLYIGLVVTACQLLFIVLLRRSSLLHAVAAGAFAALLWLPQLRTFLAQAPRGGVAWPWALSHPGYALAQMPGAMTFDPQFAGGVLLVYAAIAAWCWLAVAAFVAWRLSRDTLLPWLFAPSIVLLAYSLVLHKAFYFERYHLLAADGLAALTGVGIASLWNTNKSWAIVSGGVLLCALVAFSSTFALVPAFYTAPWPNVARLVTAVTQPSDLIVLDQGNSFDPLQRMDALRGRTVLPVFGAADIPLVLEKVGKQRRILYIGFQWGPVDPERTTYARLAGSHRAVRSWLFPRQLPGENVDITLFEK